VGAVINTHLKGTFAVTRRGRAPHARAEVGALHQHDLDLRPHRQRGPGQLRGGQAGNLRLTKVTALDMARYNVTAKLHLAVRLDAMIGTIPNRDGRPRRPAWRR